MIIIKAEVWKDISDYIGLYQVSNFGNVKSLSRKRVDRNQILEEKILAKQIKKNGYQFVTLFKNNKEKKLYIHRLVAQAFIENPYNYKEINHIDENKTNNYVDNLEWRDRKYNCNYGSRNRKRYKKILQYDLEDNFIKEWESMKDIKLYFNKKNNCGDISSCIHNKQHSAFGYKWKLKQ